MNETTTKRISMSLEEYDKDLQDQMSRGYALCMQHVKTIMDTGTIAINEDTDEATKDFWNKLISKLACKCEQKESV